MSGQQRWWSTWLAIGFCATILAGPPARAGVALGSETVACGNAILDADEECDDGGTCIGSTNAGAVCTAAAQCPGGACTPFGGDGCAANCTFESDVQLDLASASEQVFLSELLTMSSVQPQGSLVLTIGKERERAPWLRSLRFHPAAVLVDSDAARVSVPRPSRSRTVESLA